MDKEPKPNKEENKERSVEPGTYDITTNSFMAQMMLVLYWQQKNAGMLSTMKRNDIYEYVWNAGVDGSRDAKSYACAYGKYVERALQPGSNLPTQFTVTRNDSGELDLRELETVFRHVEDIYNELQETGDEKTLFHERTLSDNGNTSDSAE